MFRAIWSKSLRDYRVPVLAWGIGLGLFMILVVSTATPTVLAAYASIAPLFSFLGNPYALQTPEGYITFRYLGLVVPLMLSFWPILAGSRLVRGEEERGTLDVLLATPQSRVRLLLEKVGALLIALVLIAVMFALGIMFGEANLRHVTILQALLTGLNVSLMAFFFGMMALLISQFTTSRGAAAGGASGLLLLALLLDIAGRETQASWMQYLSPFYYYRLNRPLIAGFPNTPVAALLLLGLSLLFAVLSLVFFVRRDIGRPAFSWQRRQQANAKLRTSSSLGRAERALSTRSVSLHALSAQAWATFWWMLGILIFCVYVVFLTPSLQKPFYRVVQGAPFLRQLFFDTPTSTNAGLLGTIIFTFLPALVIVLAFTLALKWSADLENGRLELIFSTPQSRPRILLERFSAALLVIVLAPLLTWLALILGALLFNLDVDQGRIAAASFSMFPPALLTLSLVYALAGRVRYGAVLGLVTAYLVVAFLQESVEGMFQIPAWVMSLSIFHLYGNPIFLGMNWNNFLGMTGVAIVLLMIGVVQFRYADISLG